MYAFRPALAAVLALTALAAAAPDPITALEFERVSHEEGVATDRVFCLHEDRAGFL